MQLIVVYLKGQAIHATGDDPTEAKRNSNKS